MNQVVQPLGWNKKVVMIKFDKYIGIDAGANGAIAYISEGGIVKTVSMPRITSDNVCYTKLLRAPYACDRKLNLEDYYESNK